MGLAGNGSVQDEGPVYHDGTTGPDEQTTRLLNPHDYSRDDSDEHSRSPTSWLSYEEDAKPRWQKSNPRRVVTICSLAVLLAVVCGAVGYRLGLSSTGAPAVESKGGDTASFRVMVVGDSITQGLEGAYTWRYRLWKWFQDNNINATFVGPYNGTWPQLSDDKPSLIPMFGPVTRSNVHRAPDPTNMIGGYALDIEPEFLNTGCAHFAIWGQQAAQDIDEISLHVREYNPDYILMELGFNDLAWGMRGPEGTLQAIGQLIENSRAVNPNLRFAIGSVPQRTSIGEDEVLSQITREYNLLLLKAIPQWSTSRSPIELARVVQSYSCDRVSCPAGHDGLHPNPQGEIEIAFAFSEALHTKFNIGENPISLPYEFPAYNCTTPLNPNIYRGEDGVKFRWDLVYGAYAYEVQARPGGTDWPTDFVNYTQVRHLDSPWLTDGSLWEFRVRSYCGQTVKSPWTAQVSSASR